jgi:hypothetical protein
MKNVEEMPPITLHVKSEIPGIRSHRKQVCRRVREYFQRNFQVPSQLRVLCFFDDRDAPEVKAECGGPANRGVHWPVRGQGLAMWPDYMWNIIAPIDTLSHLTWPFDSVIYLHGSTCEEDVGLTITFAHELQHFLQYANERRIWAVNVLLMNLPNLPTEDLKMPWDIPIEREARTVAKQVAESLYGEDIVRRHAMKKIDAHATDNDAKDWTFFRDVDPSTVYCVADATKSLVERYKPELKQLQQLPECRNDPDFSAIDFDTSDWSPWSD